MLQECYIRPVRSCRWPVRRYFCAILVVVTLAVISPAQTPSPDGQQTAASTDPKAGAKPVAKVPDDAEKIKRWVELDTLSLAARYRHIRVASAAISVDQAQWQFAGRGKFKFDRKGKYTLNFGLYTGDLITSGWNNTGWGTGNPQSNIYLKHLFIAARPVKWLEAQFGSFGPNNGEGTEVTGYDNDVYMTGERVKVRAPKKAYFDEISYTAAFVGDITRPGVLRRLNRFNDWNHHQLLVRKQVNKRVGFSADYSYENPRHALHQAVRVKVPESRVLDVALFEHYFRVHPDNGYGFNVYGEKALNKNFTLSGGFARIDRALLNSDRFPPGKRIYINTSYKISPEFTFSSALTQGLGNLPTPVSPRTRLDIILTYNFLETLKKLKLQ